MSELVKLLVFSVFLCSCTQSRLVQVGGNGTICSNHIALLWCTSEEFPFLNWDVRTRTTLTSTFNFEERDLVRTTKNRTLNSSSIVAEVISNNGSFINATVTIMRPINLNGSTITCNADTLTLNIPMTSTPPTALNISQNEHTGILDIHWNSEGNCYYIQVNGSTNSVFNASYTLLLINTTYEVTISPYPEMNMTPNFTIGPCLFYDQLIIERKYVLDLNGTWTIFQECTNSIIQFNTRCGSSGSWTTDMRCPAITTEMNKKITLTSYIFSVELAATLNEATEHRLYEEKSSKVKLLPFLIPIVVTIIVIAIVIVLTIIILLKLTLKKKKKDLSKEYQAQTETSEMTYQRLSYKHYHHKSNAFSGMPLHAAKNEMCDQGEYSSLHHKKAYQTSNDEYNTIPNIHHSETAKATKPMYTDVDTSGHNGPMGCDLIHIKVDYADINLRARPEDETLNLDSLLIQLKPKCKDFKLFGSVAGISPDTLDKIVASCAAPYDGLVEVCDAWLDKCRKEKNTPTWSAVADILSLIGQEKLSRDIMRVYITGKLPIEVDMNSVNVQGEVHQFSPPPPIPPHLYEDNEDIGSEVELMTVTSVMTTRQLPSTRDTAMEELPPIPEILHDKMPAEENEESCKALPELPLKQPVQELQKKPFPAKCIYAEVVLSLPPRLPKNSK